MPLGVRSVDEAPAHPRDGVDPDATLRDVEGYVAERLAPYKRVRRYELIEAIPRTPSGKIVRRGLIERERLAAVAP